MESRILDGEVVQRTVSLPRLGAEGVVASPDAAAPNKSVVARGDVDAVAVRPSQITRNCDLFDKDLGAIQEVHMETRCVCMCN